MKITAEHRKSAVTGGDYLVVIGGGPEKGAEKKQDKPARSSSPRIAKEARELLQLVSSEAVLVAEALAAQQDYTMNKGKRLEVTLVDGRSASRFIRLSGVSREALSKTDRLDEWRRAGGDALQSCGRRKARSLVLLLPSLGSIRNEVVRAIAEGLVLGGYEFRQFKGTGSKKKQPRSLPEQILIYSADGDAKKLQAAIDKGTRCAESVAFARDLINTPPSSLPPSKVVAEGKKILAARGTKSGGRKAPVTLKVLDAAQLKRLGAGALLGVGQGSDAPPYMLHFHYRPAKPARGAAQKVVTLIGKGITFDSGGLSIKTGKGMEDMKCDMSGAACVLAVMRAIVRAPAAERPTCEIHGLIPTAENMINGQSIKPGDVLTALDGTTIEVLNTDAEGRLILADALAYSARWKSDVTIDLATLTGACVVALGGDYAGLFASDDELSAALVSHGTVAGERLWRLPLAPEYRDQLESDVADLRNIGTGGPGAILGALFLKEFVPHGTKWAHLDIAGPAFVGRGGDYTSKGGTGFGVRTLLSYLESGVMSPA